MGSCRNACHESPSPLVLQNLFSGNKISFLASVLYIAPQLPMLFVMASPLGRVTPFSYRIISMQVFQAALMLVLGIFSHQSYYLTLVCIFLVGLSTAILQSSTLGFTRYAAALFSDIRWSSVNHPITSFLSALPHCSMFPPVFNQGVMFGQGLAGILACVLNIIVMLALGGTTYKAAVVYYALAALAIVGCLVSYLVMLRRPFTKYWIAKSLSGSSSGQTEGAAAEDGEMITGVTSGSDDASASHRDGAAVSATVDSETSKLVLRIGSDDSTSTSVIAVPQRAEKATALGVSRAVWLEGLAVWLVFTVTFTVFPGIAPFELKYYGTAPSSGFDVWWQQVRAVRPSSSSFDVFKSDLRRLVLDNRIFSAMLADLVDPLQHHGHDRALSTLAHNPVSPMVALGAQNAYLSHSRQAPRTLFTPKL